MTPIVNSASTQSSVKKWFVVFDNARYQAYKLEIKNSSKQGVYKLAETQKMESNQVLEDIWPSLMESQSNEEISLQKLEQHSKGWKPLTSILMMQQ